MTSLFCCPICGSPLTREERSYHCPNCHSYDISKEGYTHLLPANFKHSAAPGDDKEMARSRWEFLSKGYYAPLLEALCREINARTGTSSVLLDCGCGEGYYTAGIAAHLRESGKAPRVAGTDISKFILRYAAKRDRDIEFAVASSNRLPLAEGSVDVLLNCFSPLFLEEFRRVLKPGGYFFYVVPAADHLWEMKQVLYDNPYRNEEKETPYEGFDYDAIVPVESVIQLENQADIQALFGMTPYAWKTPKAGKDRLAALDSLACRIAFHIHIFRRQ